VHEIGVMGKENIYQWLILLVIGVPKIVVNGQF